VELAQQFNPEAACIFVANADLELRDILEAMGFGQVNRKYFVEAIKKLNKRSVIATTFSPSQLSIYAAELRGMFQQICATCSTTGHVSLKELNQIDVAYFNEGFKENFMTCVNDPDLSRSLEIIAASWYKLRYSGEMLDYLVRVIIWHGRISESRYEEHWANATEVYEDCVENLKASMKKCGIRL